MIAKLQPYTLALLRIVTAFLFFTHGIQKTAGAFGGLPARLPPNMLMMLHSAGWIETIGSVFIFLGLFTSPVAFILAGEMAVAFFTAHVPRGHFLPIQNGGAEAVLNCFIYLYLFTAGPGAWALDNLRKKKKR